MHIMCFHIQAELEDVRGLITRLDEVKLQADEEKKHVKHQLRDLRLKQKLVIVSLLFHG